MVRHKTTTYWMAAAAILVLAGSQSALAAEGYLVDYRLSKWKSSHFDDVKRADAHHAALTKLGCQAKKSAHDGHYDVSYACPKWRRITLKNHDEAHQWEKWLKAYGFETKHSH